MSTDFIELLLDTADYNTLVERLTLDEWRQVRSLVYSMNHGILDDLHHQRLKSYGIARKLRIKAGKPV